MDYYEKRKLAGERILKMLKNSVDGVDYNILQAYIQSTFGFGNVFIDRFLKPYFELGLLEKRGGVLIWKEQKEKKEDVREEKAL